MFTKIELRFVNICYQHWYPVLFSDNIHAELCDFSQRTHLTPEVLFLEKAKLQSKTILVKLFPETID